jgi:hypothetical protein
MIDAGSIVEGTPTCEVLSMSLRGRLRDDDDDEEDEDMLGERREGRKMREPLG